MTETPGFSNSLYFGIGVWDSRDTFKKLGGGGGKSKILQTTNVKKPKIVSLSLSHGCEKAIIITHSEWVSVALLIQNAKRMRHIVLPSVACLAAPNFSTLPHLRELKGTKLTLNMKFIYDFLYDFETFLILRRNGPDIFINVVLHVTYPLLLSDFNKTRNCSTCSRKLLQCLRAGVTQSV